MVREFGLSESVGPVGYPSGGSMFLNGGAGELSRPFAEATQAAIDKEVARLLRQAEARATQLLTDNRRYLDELVNLVLEQETIDGAAVYRIIGRPAPTEAGQAPVAPRQVAATIPTGDVESGPPRPG
jgi:cell division protease FtsH